MSQTQGIRDGPLSVGFASHTQRGSSKGIPQWGWSYRPGAHAWPHMWLVLLASHGCPGKETYWKLLSMSCLQSQAAQIPSWKYHGHTSLGACPPRSLVSGTREGLEENVPVVTDHFPRYIQVYVTRTQTSQTTAKTLWNKFIVHYGLPEKILSDQGQNFESQLVADLCMLMGTQKIWTSP